MISTGRDTDSGSSRKNSSSTVTSNRAQLLDDSLQRLSAGVSNFDSVRSTRRVGKRSSRGAFDRLVETADSDHGKEVQGIKATGQSTGQTGQSTDHSTDQKLHRWMAYISPEVSIWSLTLAGTHHSTAYNFKNADDNKQPFMRTQNKSVYDQLLKGVRWLHTQVVKVKSTGDVVCGVCQFQPYSKTSRRSIRKARSKNLHRRVKATVRITMPFELLLETIKAFLSSFPTESVFLHIEPCPNLDRRFKELPLQALLEVCRDSMGPFLYEEPLLQGNDQLHRMQGRMIPLIGNEILWNSLDYSHSDNPYSVCRNLLDLAEQRSIAPADLLRREKASESSRSSPTASQGTSLSLGSIFTMFSDTERLNSKVDDQSSKIVVFHAHVSPASERRQQGQILNDVYDGSELALDAVIVANALVDTFIPDKKAMRVPHVLLMDYIDPQIVDRIVTLNRGKRAHTPPHTVTFPARFKSVHFVAHRLYLTDKGTYPPRPGLGVDTNSTTASPIEPLSGSYSQMQSPSDLKLAAESIDDSDSPKGTVNRLALEVEIAQLDHLDPLDSPTRDSNDSRTSRTSKTPVQTPRANLRQQSSASKPSGLSTSLMFVQRRIPVLSLAAKVAHTRAQAVEGIRNLIAQENDALESLLRHLLIGKRNEKNHMEVKNMILPLSRKTKAENIKQPAPRSPHPRNPHPFPLFSPRNQSGKTPQFHQTVARTPPSPLLPPPASPEMYTAAIDFNGIGPNDLSVKIGDPICFHARSEINPGWIIAKSKGNVGFLPQCVLRVPLPTPHLPSKSLGRKLDLKIFDSKRIHEISEFLKSMPERIDKMALLEERPPTTNELEREYMFKFPKTGYDPQSIREFSDCLRYSGILGEFGRSIRDHNTNLMHLERQCNRETVVVKRTVEHSPRYEINARNRRASRSGYESPISGKEYSPFQSERRPRERKGQRRYSTSNSSHHSRRTGRTRGSSAGGAEDFFSDSDFNSEDDLDVAPLHIRLLTSSHRSKLVPTEPQTSGNQGTEGASQLSKSLSNIERIRGLRSKKGRTNRKDSKEMSRRDSRTKSRRLSSRVSRAFSSIKGAMVRLRGSRKRSLTAPRQKKVHNRGGSFDISKDEDDS